MSVWRFFFKDRSLWFKFSLMTVLPVVLAALFFVVVITNSVETSMEQHIHTSVAELVRLAGLSMSNASVIYNKNLLDNFVNSLADYQDILFATVVDESDGRILAHSRHHWDGTFFDPNSFAKYTVSDESPESFPAQIDILTFPIAIEGKTYGTIAIGYSTKGAIREVNAFRARILTVAVFAVAVGVLLAVVLARLVSGPIKTLAAKAQQIGAGDFSQEISHDSRDALGQLARSFNSMVSGLHDRQTQLMAIIGIAEKLHQSLDWKTVIHQSAEILAELSGSPTMAVFTKSPDEDVLHLIHHRGFSQDTLLIASTLPVEGSLSGIAVREQDIVTSPEIARDERVESRVREALAKEGLTGGAVCLPLVCRGLVMGVVNLIYKEPYVLPENKRNTLLAIGRTIALALANADQMARVEAEIRERKKVEQALRHSVEEMSVLSTLARRTGRFLSIDQVATATIESLHDPISPDLIMVYSVEETMLRLRGYRTRPIHLEEKELNAHRVGECLCGLCASEGQAIYSADIANDSRCTRSECRRKGLRSFAALPLLSAGRVIGVLGLASFDERDFSQEAAFLETLAGQVAIALTNATLHEQIQRQALELERRVTERTAALEVAMGKAREADRIKSAFLASMSHELRTPLNSIIGFTGILLQGLTGSLNDEQLKQLGMVQNSARHLLKLINDVLDISKIEAGQLEVHFEPFNLTESIQQVIRTVLPLAERKSIKLVPDLAPELGEMVSDQRRVEQILINLVTNAVKFTDSGEVRVHCEMQEKRVVISVIDTGIGIRKENLEKLFQPFCQVDTGIARRYEGTGLGLSISRKLVEMLGGRIWARSEGEGHGCTFAFTLPLLTSL